jgi:hypothetical protein
MPSDLDFPPNYEQANDLKHLKGWYQDYIAVDADDLYKDHLLIQSVNSDKLDESFVEQRILESTLGLSVTKGFCIKCQDLFDNWPTLGHSSPSTQDSEPNHDDEGWEHTVARSCSTYELEGGARSGCRMCAFLLQSLKDDELLETFRKIEARFYRLDNNTMSSLSVQNWTTEHQILWLNLPGKMCTHCNNGIALDASIDSCFLPALGMLCYQFSVHLNNTFKPIATTTLLIFSILRATGSLLAPKATSSVRAVRACCLLG